MRAERYLNVYFIALPDPIGINKNVALHFVYDDRKTPYLATSTINERADLLLLRVGSKLDVTIGFTHVPAAPADYQLRSAAAVSALEYFKGDTTVLENVDPLNMSGNSDKFRPSRVITIAEVAVYEEVDGNAQQTETEIEDLADPLLRSLHCVGHLVEAYNLTSETPARVPTYARVGPQIPALRRQLTVEHPDWSVHLQPLNHSNFGDHRQAKLLEPIALAQVLKNVQLLSAGDIRALFRRAVVEAQQLFLVDGDYASSAVKSAQACEILFDGILGLLLWEEFGGAPQDGGDIAAAVGIFELGLLTRIKRVYHTRLGGQWNPTGQGAVGNWYRSVAAVRNRIVHRGYEPTADEAAGALNATNDLDRFVTQRIAMHARKFPRTALMWVGKDVLEEQGKWHLVRAFAKDRQLTEPPWRDGYASWRDKVDAEVAGVRRN
ncbi:hypothetical protein ACPCIR_05525 [Mycobacterium sp. NPDC051198]